MSFIRVLSCLFVAVAFTSIHAEELKFDAEKSSITFVGSKSDGSHEGGFKKFDVKADANMEHPEESTLVIEIDATSIWSDNPRLTNHLKSPDFFNVRKYPKITFQSTQIIPDENDKRRVTIKGDLEMLGKKVAIDVPVTVIPSETTIELKTQMKLDRTKWGMTYGEGKINNDVKVNASIVFKLPQRS